MRTFLSASIIALAASLPAVAATFDGTIRPNTGNEPTNPAGAGATWDFGTDEVLALAGIYSGSTGLQGDTFSLDILNDSGAYTGTFTGLWVADFSAFNESLAFGDKITGEVTLSGTGMKTSGTGADFRVFDAVYVSYADTADIVVKRPGGTDTFSGSATLTDPAPINPIPVPAGLPLLVGAFGALAFLRRKAA